MNFVKIVKIQSYIFFTFSYYPEQEQVVILLRVKKKWCQSPFIVEKTLTSFLLTSAYVMGTIMVSYFLKKISTEKCGNIKLVLLILKRSSLLRSFCIILVHFKEQREKYCWGKVKARRVVNEAGGVARPVCFVSPVKDLGFLSPSKGKL